MAIPGLRDPPACTRCPVASLGQCGAHRQTEAQDLQGECDREDDAQLAVANAPASDELGDVTMLRRELCRALTYSLHHGLGDDEPGCDLNADGKGLLPAVKDLPEPVFQLWRAVADSVTEPAANARFHDLLCCRRDRGAGLHAACAARAYLQLADTGTVDMDAMEFLLRAWTVARRISDADLDHQARTRLGQIIDDMQDEPCWPSGASGITAGRPRRHLRRDCRCAP
ncbi:hypothetical protein AB0F59_26130 [Micromonospora lupini]|uniref:DUF7380 domain-containing protein n=1 Tax=Micromonospora lupini TaxID=285679 RepID=UPI0033DA3ACF